MTRFISVADCDFGFCECMKAQDFENASSYYESLKHHYKKRGKQIKTLLNNKCKIIKEKDKQISKLQAEVENLHKHIYNNCKCNNCKLQKTLEKVSSIIGGKNENKNI